MKKELSKSFLLLKTSIKKHSPEILTGIGIAGMITTTVMAVRATPKSNWGRSMGKSIPKDSKI